MKNTKKEFFYDEISSLTLKPKEVWLYLPPIVWKGDSVGHMGINDTFFWIVRGECFLNIDGVCYIAKAGQLAFLPKEKMRSYTHVSKDFVMYEMTFDATLDNKNLMQLFGFDKENLVVDIEDSEAMNKFFEMSYRKEMHKNPIYAIGWCANLANIINTYALERERIAESENKYFRNVIDYMTANICSDFGVDDLATMAHMQTTYFIRQFKKTYGIAPVAYFNRLRIYKAMELLASTNLHIDVIAGKVGFSDSSYFSRTFKKMCNITPGQYRMEFYKK